MRLRYFKQVMLDICCSVFLGVLYFEEVISELLFFFFRFVYDNRLEHRIGLLGIVNDLSSKEELDWLVRCGVSRVSIV